jgi:hypothetical protein
MAEGLLLAPHQVVKRRVARQTPLNPLAKPAKPERVQGKDRKHLVRAPMIRKISKPHRRIHQGLRQETRRSKARQGILVGRPAVVAKVKKGDLRIQPPVASRAPGRRSARRPMVTMHLRLTIPTLNMLVRRPISHCATSRTSKITPTVHSWTIWAGRTRI